MKYLPLLFLILPTGPALLTAQEADDVPQAGFLTIVNLITLKTPTFVELGSWALNGGEPVKPGDSSGVLAIKPATYPLTLRNEGAKPDKVTGNFVMEDGKTAAIICYDEVKEYRDGSRESKLRYNVLVESDAPTGPRLSLVSLLGEPLVGIEVSGVAVTLAQRLAHQAGVSLHDHISLTYQGRNLAEFEIAKPIHYIGFLFQNPESGEIEMSLIQNEKLEYHPPLETEDEDE